MILALDIKTGQLGKMNMDSVTEYVQILKSAAVKYHVTPLGYLLVKICLEPDASNQLM